MTSIWAAGFALLYDPFLWLGEQLGMKRHRRDLLAQARGRVVEIGAGTGLNIRHYPAGLDELLLTEPDPKMYRRLARRAAAVRAPAERLPAPDGSVDTVVSTFVLCTVPDPAAALREIRRILRPDGQLLLIEHVRSHSPSLAFLQRLLRRPWQAFACGCRCDQDTESLLRAAGFHADLRPVAWRGMPSLVRPLIVGHARMSI